MTAVGRALMSWPRLILFDEPSLGLAPFMGEQTLRIVQHVRRGGAMVLMVEQNANLSLRMAGLAYLLEAGRVARQGNARDLWENPYVRRADLGG